MDQSLKESVVQNKLTAQQEPKTKQLTRRQKVALSSEQLKQPTRELTLARLTPMIEQPL
jgi:hypothetical protein